MKNQALYRRAISLAVPMMIQNGITNAVGLVDNVMVGSLGTEALTGVSIVGQLIFVFNLAIFGGLSGPGIYGAQFYGQGDKEGFRNTVRMKLWVCLLCLVVGTLLFCFHGTTLIDLYLHGESVEIDKALTMDYAKQYLTVMLFGLPAFAFTQVYAGSLRETGNSIKPMVAGVASVVADIILNYLLIYGKFGCPKLGVKGAAVATVIARLIEFAVIVIWTHAQIHKHAFLRGIYRTLRLPTALAKRMFAKGFPIFCNEFLWAGGIAALTQSYSTRGLIIIAGLNISNALCNLLNVVFVALGNSVGILIGQTLGAQQYEQAKTDSSRLMWFTGCMSAGLTVILLAVSGVFPLLYDTTAEVRQYGQAFIAITALFFPVQGFLNALYFTLRSGGKTLITFIFDSVYTWIVPVPCAFLLCHFTTLPILLVYAIIQSADFVKMFIGYRMIRKGIWISNLVDEQALSPQ